MNRPTTSLSKFKSFVTGKDQKWQVYWQSLKHTIPGSEEQKQSTLRKRVLKFFKDFKVDEQTCYNQRREIKAQNNAEIVFSREVIMLYGIDYLQTQKIKEYFSPYDCEVQKIDFSHCIVIFSDENSCLYAYYQNLVNKPANVQLLIDLLVEKNNELITWREIRGYKQLCFDKKLWVRFAPENQLVQLRHFNQQSKDLKTYQMIKQEFMEKMNRIYMKKNPNSNFTKRQRQQKCSCCQIKMNKLRQMLKCCHKNKHNSNKGRKIRQRSAEKDKERSRSRDNQKKSKGYKFQALERILANVQPLSIVKKLTELERQNLQIEKKEKTVIKQKLNRSSSFISQIGKIKNDSDQDQDPLCRDLILQLQKHNPFGESKELANVSINSKMNSSKYTVFDQFSEDDEI